LWKGLETGAKGEAKKNAKSLELPCEKFNVFQRFIKLSGFFLELMSVGTSSNKCCTLAHFGTILNFAVHKNCSHGFIKTTSFYLVVALSLHCVHMTAFMFH